MREQTNISRKRQPGTMEILVGDLAVKSFFARKDPKLEPIFHLLEKEPARDGFFPKYFVIEPPGLCCGV